MFPEELTTKVREISFDGIISETDERLATGLSRTTRWRLEKEGKYPKRVQLSPGRVGRLGREVRDWIQSRPRVGLVECEMESIETKGRDR